MNFAALQFGSFLVLLLVANALLRRHELRNARLLLPHLCFQAPSGPARAGMVKKQPDFSIAPLTAPRQPGAGYWVSRQQGQQ